MPDISGPDGTALAVSEGHSHVCIVFTLQGRQRGWQTCCSASEAKRNICKVVGIERRAALRADGLGDEHLSIARVEVSEAIRRGCFVLFHIGRFAVSFVPYCGRYRWAYIIGWGLLPPPESITENGALFWRILLAHARACTKKERNIFLHQSELALDQSLRARSRNIFWFGHDGGSAARATAVAAAFPTTAARTALSDAALTATAFPTTAFPPTLSR